MATTKEEAVRMVAAAIAWQEQLGASPLRAAREVYAQRAHLIADAAIRGWAVDDYDKAAYLAAGAAVEVALAATETDPTASSPSSPERQS